MATINEIIFFNGAGQPIGSVSRSAYRRFSMQAAADHRAMDLYRSEHPLATLALIGSFRFEFDAYGHSFMVSP